MSIKTFLKYGAGIGTAGGMLSGAYFYWDAQSYYKMYDKPNDHNIVARWAAFNLYSQSLDAAINSLMVGPPLGLTTAASIYCTKRAITKFCFAEPKTQKHILLALAIAISTLAIAKIAKEE